MSSIPTENTSQQPPLASNNTISQQINSNSQPNTLQSPMQFPSNVNNINNSVNLNVVQASSSSNTTIAEINSIPFLQHISRDPNSPSFIPPVSTSVNFSHQTLPKNKEIADQCGPIPIGALFSPLKPLVRNPPLLMRPATRCKNCSAYINCFCVHNFSNGMWECVLCGAKNDK